MSENLRKLIGVAVVAAIVVVGIVVTNDDDSDFTRNAMLLQGINQARDDGEIEALEMRLMRIEKLVGQIPELEILAEVIDQAEAGSAEVRASVERSNRQISESVEEVSDRAERAHERIRWWIGIYEAPNTREAINEIWNESIAEFEGIASGLTAQIDPLNDEMTAWLANNNAQLEGLSPQFGPELPGLGPMVEILCRTQLASWGVTARGVSAGWDMYEEFWACAYDRIQLEELRGREGGADSVAFCLPGEEFSRRGNGPPASLFESIGRRGTVYSGWEDTLNFEGVCSSNP